MNKHEKDHKETTRHQDAAEAQDAARAQEHANLDKLIDQRVNATVAQRQEPPKVAPRPSNQSSGLCIECGKPTAPGQNEVCVDHVRTA